VLFVAVDSTTHKITHFRYNILLTVLYPLYVLLTSSSFVQKPSIQVLAQYLTSNSVYICRWASVHFIENITFKMIHFPTFCIIWCERNSFLHSSLYSLKFVSVWNPLTWMSWLVFCCSNSSIYLLLIFFMFR
jgi:hypothetical protein